jgi:hypothetical protein
MFGQLNVFMTSTHQLLLDIKTVVQIQKTLYLCSPIVTWKILGLIPHFASPATPLGTPTTLGLELMEKDGIR